MSLLFPYFLLFKKALFLLCIQGLFHTCELAHKKKGEETFFSLRASLIFPSSSSSSSYDPLLSVLIPVLLPMCVCKSLMCLFLGKALGRKTFLKAPFVFPPTLFRFRYQSSLFFSLLSPARGRREPGCYRKSLLPEEQRGGGRGIGVLEREAGESLLYVCL